MECHKCGKRLSAREFYIIKSDNYCDDCYKQIIVRETKNGDSVNHPAHYASGNVECIDALQEIAKGKDPFVAHCLCTTVKYLWRAGSKEPDQTKGQTQKEKLIEDLEKAKWYLEKAISYTKTSN